MKPQIILIFLATSLFFISCSGDKTEQPPATQSAPAQVKAKPSTPALNTPNAQDLHPDLHISGSKNTHISGAISTSEHISGQ